MILKKEGNCKWRKLEGTVGRGEIFQGLSCILEGDKVYLQGQVRKDL